MTNEEHINIRTNIGRLHKVIAFLESPEGEKVLAKYKKENTLKKMMQMHGSEKEMCLLLHKFRYILKL